MKKSSMNTAPKGRMPPMRMLNTGCMYLQEVKDQQNVAINALCTHH